MSQPEHPQGVNPQDPGPICELSGEPEGGKNGNRATGRRMDSERARELGKRSGQARRRLTLTDVEGELTPLANEQDAKHRLDRLATWLAAGLISGSQGGAAVRATEVWLKAHSEQLDRERLYEAEKRVKALERELANVRGGIRGVA